MIEERIEKAFRVPPDTPVIVRNSNGSVHVRGARGESGTVLIRRNVEPDLPHTKYVEAEIDEGPPFVIRSCYSLSRVRASVDIEVSMPAGIKSLRIETINGNIVVSDIPCRLEASSSNGFIRTSGGGGPLDLHTRNGKIDVSGPATVACLETLNGDIRVQMAALAGDPAMISTVSGSIEIGVEDGFYADFEAVTGRGAIRLNGIDVISPTTGTGMLRGTIVRGGQRFRAVARIGGISFSRASALGCQRGEQQES